MRNPINTRIRRLESVGLASNALEQDLKLATAHAKDAEGILYNLGFNEQSSRFAALHGRLKGLCKDAPLS